MFAGYKPEDSGLDIGDSAITETYGIGGFAMATAPAIVALVGGTVEEAIDFSRQMREITLGENPNVTIPLLSFMGIPTAIDITRVAGSGILPVINTAIAHKDAGIGMIGAGIVHPPFSCFEKALLTFRDRYFYKASIHENMKLEWKRGDWAAYFGLMTNNLTNLLTMMGLLILSSASRRRLFMDASRRPSGWRCWWRASATRGLACRWRAPPDERTSPRCRLARARRRFYRYFSGPDAGLPANR